VIAVTRVIPAVVAGVREGEVGQASLEIIVSLMAVIALVFGLFELCMLTYTCGVLNNSTEVGVRYAVVHGTSSSNCSGPDTVCADHAPYVNVKAAVSAAASASLHDLTAMQITVTYPNGTAAVGNPVTVAVVYVYVPYTSFGGLHNQVSFLSQGRIVY
jgi:hypothetical protein